MMHFIIRDVAPTELAQETDQQLPDCMSLFLILVNISYEAAEIIKYVF